MSERRITRIDHAEFIEFVCDREAVPADYREETRRLIEQRGVDCVRLWCLPPDLALSGADLTRIAENSVAMGLAGRLAIVAPSDLAYGLARVHLAYREPTSIFGLFRDRDQALAWIRDPQEPNSTS